MSEIHLLLLQLLDLVNLLVVQLGCVYVATGMYWFVGLLLVICMNQIRVLCSQIIHNFSIICVQLL